MATPRVDTTRLIWSRQHEANSDEELTVTVRAGMNAAGERARNSVRTLRGNRRRQNSPRMRSTSLNFFISTIKATFIPFKASIVAMDSAGGISSPADIHPVQRLRRHSQSFKDCGSNAQYRYILIDWESLTAPSPRRSIAPEEKDTA